MNLRETFYARRGKRYFDVVAAIAGVALLWPVLLLTAITVKCSSRGPICFVQERAGKRGKVFRLWKFRTMTIGAERFGPGITVSGDRRITPIGAYLRRWKLDELPQLFNVLKGDMSIVGPRPELAQYVQGYTNAQRAVFSVRPGITDLASIQYRYEEEILGSSGDPEAFYRQVILPHKLRLNLRYIQKMGFAYDLTIIWTTFRAILAGYGSRKASRVGSNRGG